MKYHIVRHEKKRGLIQEEKQVRSGFVTIVGRPNAGKSTLLNHILGTKVAIVSDKPQTTRNSIRGIYNTDDMQVVFIDTPGVHKPKHKLDERMMADVHESLSGGDIIVYLVETQESFGRGEEYIIRQLSEVKKPVFLLINKIDLIEPQKLLPLIDRLKDRYSFAEIIPISAQRGTNVDRFLEVLKQYLPLGPRFYPQGMTSDQPEQLFMAELIREQVLGLTRDEIPHSVAVNISQMEERANGTLYLEAVIYVERETQKGIVIGKRGALLKAIGIAARAEMEKFFACNVYLELRVKTKKDWRDNERLLQDWDLLGKE